MMKRYFAGGLALLLALTLALPSSWRTLAEEPATASDLNGVVSIEADDTSAPGTAVPEADAAETAASAAGTPTPEPEDATAAPEVDAAETAASAAGTPTPEPTASAIPEGEDAAAEETPLSENGPAYFWEGENRHYGELAELIPLAQALGQPVYLASTEIYELPGWTLEQARGLALALDTGVFTEDTSWVVVLSATNPAGDGAENTVYLWVSVKVTAEVGSSGAPEENEDVLEMEIQVTAQGYEQQEPCAPTFTLTAIPALTAGQSYGVETEDGEILLLDGDTFTPDASGSYRFVAVDDTGTVLARSRAWEVIILTRTQEQEAEETGTPLPGGAADGVASTPAAPAVSTSTAVLSATPMAEETDTSASTAAVASTEVPTVTPASVAEEDAVQPSQPETVAEPELLVTAVDYTPGQLSDAAPTFMLSGKTVVDWYYAVSVDDGTPLALVGDRYTATASGTYTLRFYLMDGDGQQLAASAPYAVQLDFTTESAIRKQAWMADPEGSGEQVYGTLEGLLALAPERSTIYLLTGDTVILYGSASQLAGVQLAPDPGVFATGAYTVRATTVSPLDGSAGLFVYVEEVVEAGETPALTLQVQCDQALDGSWLTVPPTFTLSCAEGLPQGGTWAVRYNGGAPVAIAGASFTVTEEGEYTLSFAVLDAAGNIVAATEDESVRLDTAAPLVQVTVGENLTLTVTASDGISGVDGLSLDGGASWYPPMELGDGVWGLTFTASEAYTFPVGTILARDGAGHLTAYQEEVTLRSSQGNRGSFPGGGGGNSGSTVATTHASSDTTAVVAYDGVDLVVADEVMTTLVMGETELELYLRPDERLQAQLGEAYQPAFTASFTNWSEDDSMEPDTLLLAVSQEDLEQAGEDGAFTWDFNGAVYKTLAASGIDYLALQVGEQMTVLSTAGFTAGVRYAMFRAQGLSSQAFDYHVAMTETGETTLSVTVDGETWTLTDQEDGEFYYYDVYTGTLAELAQIMEG